MKNEDLSTVSEEQVLFNKLSYEEQQFILKQMRMLQPCELSCEENNKLQNIDLAYIDKEYLLEKEDVDRKINEIINRHNILVDKVIELKERI